MICADSEGWSSCSEKVKKAISAATTPPEAFAAGQVWAERYEKLYAAHPSTRWTASDQERMRAAGGLLFDEAIGKYLDPAALAFDIALARYLPTLAGVLGILNSAWVIGFYMVLAPRPIANDFTAAKPVNDDINKLLFEKIDALMPLNWRSDYSSMMQRAYDDTRPGVIKP